MPFDSPPRCSLIEIGKFINRISLRNKNQFPSVCLRRRSHVSKHAYDIRTDRSKLLRLTQNASIQFLHINTAHFKQLICIELCGSKRKLMCVNLISVKTGDAQAPSASNHPLPPTAHEGGWGVCIRFETSTHPPRLRLFVNNEAAVTFIRAAFESSRNRRRTRRCRIRAVHNVHYVWECMHFLRKFGYVCMCAFVLNACVNLCVDVNAKRWEDSRNY